MPFLYSRADFDCFQVELAKNYGVNEWREDLRKVMMKAGLDNNPTVFLFSDTQVLFKLASKPLLSQASTTTEGDKGFGGSHVQTWAVR